MPAPVDVVPPILPAWAVAALLWSNGFMVAGLFALISRQRGIETIKLGLEAQITGVRVAIEAFVRIEIAKWNTDREQLSLRMDRAEWDLFSPTGLGAQLQKGADGVTALVTLFLRHGQKMGVADEDIRELESHR